ncbi:hypothetical protein KBZ94_27915 [Streptomyces sp. RM72]|uniref:hypothetical protein n=1 Tax=unclassified Streptomyces TaxID=2593676 RepID=UPI000EF56D98|nr:MULTISPECIES: hypothetical protein [unclassified Streptomyces]MBQ0888700.1 hypothetical protein [Streptomyces sp. RM72]
MYAATWWSTCRTPGGSEAQREGWLGEVEGLEISLAGAEDQWTQLDAALKPSAIHLGLPAFGEIAARTI